MGAKVGINFNSANFSSKIYQQQELDSHIPAQLISFVRKKLTHPSGLVQRPANAVIPCTGYRTHAVWLVHNIQSTKEGKYQGLLEVDCKFVGNKIFTLRGIGLHPLHKEFVQCSASGKEYPASCNVAGDLLGHVFTEGAEEVCTGESV